MKPHLPLSLRRALLKSLSGGLHKTFCSGSLMLAGIFLWNGGLAEATVSESGDSAATAITLNGEVLQDEAGATRARFSTDRLGSEEEQAEAEKEAEAASADEETVAQEKSATGQQEAELISTGEEEEEKSADRLSFTTRLMLAMEQFLSEKTVWSKGGGIEPWDPDIAYCHYRPRTIYVYLPQTRFLLIGDTYENCYGPWPPRKNNTTEDKNNAEDKDSIAEKSDKEPATSVLSTVATDTALTEKSDTSSQRTLPEATSSSDADTGSNNPSARFAAESMAMMRYSRSMLAAAASYSTSTLSASDDTVATIADANTLVWTGNANGYWDAAAPNWTPYGGNGAATTFPVSGGAALFDSTSRNRDINVTTEQNLSAMEVTSGGYNFSGGGNINISGELSIAMPGTLSGVSGEALLLTFGQANSITAGSISLSSGLDTVTTFGAAVTTTGALTITNGGSSGKAGNYVFRNGVTIGGAANITLGSDEGASAEELLHVTGNFTAGSLTLEGTAHKIFNNAVTTTSGDLVIGGHQGTADTLTDGLTTFRGAVTIAAGKKLILHNNTEAAFNSTLASAAGAGMLQTELDRGVLRINTFVSSMSSGEAYDLGTITLKGQGGLTFGARTVAQADVISNGQNLVIGGAATRADLTLTGDGTNGISGNINIDGGKVHLFAAESNDGALLGQIGGKLTVGNYAGLTLETDNIFASSANGLLVKEGATLSLGNSTQTVYGGITMKNGGVITGEEGSSLVVPETATNASLSYSGGNNQLGSTIAQGDGNTLTFHSEADGSELTLVGDITGTGILAFTGNGTASIDAELSYEGSVSVSDGSTLVLSNELSLAKADSLTVGNGGTLNVVHSDNPAELSGDLTLTDNSTLHFSGLGEHDDLPTGALQITGGGLYFDTTKGNNVAIEFDESLRNFTTYTLVTSDTSINFASGAEAGGVVVKVLGTEIASGQYEFAFYREGDQVGDRRYLYFTTMFGKLWKNASGGTWNDAEDLAASAYWNTGADNANALLRELSGTESVSITLTDTSETKHVYMDGSTSYTLNGGGKGFAEGTELTKRGAANSTDSLSATQGVLTLANVQAPGMGDVKVEGGELKLTGGTQLGVGENSTIDVNAPGIVNGIEMTGKLSVDSSSALLLSGDASAAIKGNAGKSAEMTGLHIEGTAITGTGAAGQNVIANGAVTGAQMSNIQLQGTGSINGGVLGQNMSIAGGSTQTLSGEIKLDAPVTNNGTVTLDSNVVLDIGALATEIGASATYTLFTGGSYTNWNNNTLDASNFRLNGVLLSTVAESKGNKGQVKTSVSSSGKVTLSSENVVFVNWDPAWVHDEDTTIPIIAFDFIKHKNKPFATIANNEGAWSSLYANRMGKNSTVGHNIYVAHLGDGTGSRERGAHGDVTGTAASNDFTYAWLNTEASLFSGYASGSDGSSTFYGNSYLQVTGDLANANYVVGATHDNSQYGNSYLTITAGDYTNAGLNGSRPIIAAGNYNVTKSATATAHYGDSFLHLSGGKFGTVHGGSYGTYTEAASFTVTDNGKSVTKTPTGLTHVLIDGTAVVDTVYGGDFTSSETTHTGDVLIDIKGGTVKNVYAVGSPDGTNKNKLDGSATVNIYATDGVLDASHFTEGGILYGGVPSLVSPRSADNPTGDISTLNFKTEDSLYDLRPLNIQWFNLYELADGAHVIVATDGFNTTNALEVTGAGMVEVLGNNADKNTTPHDIALLNGATLWLNTSHYQSTEKSSTPSLITLEEGTAVNASYTITDSDQEAMNIHLKLQGTGTHGEGALYKNEGTSLAKGTSFPQITLTGDATMSLDSGTNLYMVSLTAGADNTTVYDGTTLDLRNGSEDAGGYNARGYVLTLNGGGTLGLYNTDILGGTLNVASGILQSNMSSNADNTDMVLRKGATLELTNTDDGTGYFGDEPNSDTPAAFNGFSIESLNGSGTVDLGNKGWLCINMDKGYTAFAEGVDTTGLGDYAHFSGTIAKSGGKVTKNGSGYQYFSGANSLYSGGTTLMGGRLYALASSTAGVFKKESGASQGVTEVSSTRGGVFGTGDLTWEGGALYLANGVNIYNNGAAIAGKDIVFGVESHAAADASVTYDVATYSGVLSGGDTADGHTGTLVKEGGGTLILAQDGTFAGPVEVKEGSLNLRRWVDADDYASVTVNSGATLVFTYDNTGTNPSGVVNEITETSTGITISGTGDPRWLTLGKGTRTAALCSGIADSKFLELAGVIQDGATIGNLLHSGEGTLILSGANTYSGGSAIDGGETYNGGTVIVAHNTGLGSTAEGKHANLETELSSHIIFEKAVSTTLAATKAGEYTGNDIRGRVSLRNDATLTMAGNGYYSTRTELENGSTLIFCGADSANWDGANNKEKPEGTTEMVGAGTLAGSAGATVAVSDAAGRGTLVYFQVTDAMPEDASSGTQTKGYAGDLVVEGDKVLLHVQGGQLNGGNYSVSGYGARLDAKRSLINVESGRMIALRSLGDNGSAPQSTACLAAYRVEVATGGTLSSTRGETEFSYNELGLEDVMNSEATANLRSYMLSSETDYHYINSYTEAEGYEHFFDHNNAINQYTAATLDTVGGLTMQSGSVYEVSGTNTGLAGTQLTLDTSGDGGRILLRGGTPFQEYIDRLAEAGTQDTEETEQWVLFSDVGSFTAVNKVASMTCSMQAGNPANQIFVARANEFVVASGADGQTAELADNILLVYDAGAQVLYLDRKPNIYTDAVPEPGTATLSLLALTALMARRRRK